MKITIRLKAYYGEMLTQFSNNFFIRVALVPLLITLMISGCVTNAEFLAQNSSSAMNTALTRGRFELNCSEATGTVLSQKVTYINGLGVGVGSAGYEWAEYTIGVKGCDKQAVYMVACRDQDNCNAFAQTNQVLTSGQ